MLNELAITDRDAIALGAAMYAAAFLCGALSLLLRKPYSHALTFTLLCGGCLLQTLGLNLRGAQIRACPLGNIFEITQFICWSLVLLYFIIGPAFRLRLLGFFTAGLAATLSGASLAVRQWDAAYPAGIFGGNPWVELHAALAMLSYAIFAVVALVSTMFLLQQHG